MLISMLMRRIDGLSLRKYPMKTVNMARARKGISSNLPASAYFMLNLYTISSLRLSLKQPKET